MQLPSARSDLLMFAPSLILAPLLVVTVALSEPARSISDILAYVTSVLSPAVRAFWWMNTCVCVCVCMYVYVCVCVCVCV